MPGEEPKPPALNETALRTLRTAIYLLVSLYIAPLVLLMWSFVVTSDGFNQVDAILQFFVGFTASSDESLSLLHRVLLPMIGVFAPLAFRDDSTSRATIFLMVLLISGIGLSIALSAIFNSPTIRVSLHAHSLFELPSGIATVQARDAAFKGGMGLISAFFNRTQEAMGMYLMLLFGLKLERAVK